MVEAAFPVLAVTAMVFSLSLNFFLSAMIIALKSKDLPVPKGFQRFLSLVGPEA